MPGESQNWKAIAAERMGLINLTRTYGLPVHAPDRGLVWLKTTTTSDRKQTKKLNIERRNVREWMLLGCVFALPDLTASTNRRSALLYSLTLWWCGG